MLINSYIITYLICSLISLFMGIITVFNGFIVLKKWDINSLSEDQYRLEKKIYLIITIVTLGFFLRFIMIPLWFITLGSMVGSINGAMCLVGVHSINPYVSYTSTSFKLILPLFYGYWIFINLLDRQVPTQPFIKQKLFFLMPLGLFIIAETCLDITFFFSVPPRQVSCCTSIFDIPRNEILLVVAESTWLWVICFYVFALVVIAALFYLLRTHKKNTSSYMKKWFGNKTLMTFETIFLSLFIIVFVLSLHTKISPLFLDLPFHHCVFCLCRDFFDALFASALILIGTFFLIIYFWTVSIATYKDVDSIFKSIMIRLLKFSTYSICGGVLIITIHMLLVI